MLEYLLSNHSFVGTYMETHAEQLMFENISKNMSDADEYPAMMQVSFLFRLIVLSEFL
jgi:glutamate/tyrosine decarboxylase-like PLP-dependent enzyme